MNILSYLGNGSAYQNPSFPGGSSANDPRQLALNSMFASGKLDPMTFYHAPANVQSQLAQQSLGSAQALGNLANTIAAQRAAGKQTQAIDPSALIAAKGYLNDQAMKMFAPIMNQMGPLSWLKPGQTAPDPGANPLSWLAPGAKDNASFLKLPSAGLLG